MVSPIDIVRRMASFATIMRASREDFARPRFGVTLSIMWPILGRYGPFFLYSFTVILALGIVAALGITAILARRYRLSGWPEGLIVAGVAAVMSGRVVFVILNTPYFVENPAESWQVWRGGLNPHGALLAGLAVYWAWTRVTGRPWGDYAGFLAPGLALLAASGWAACWFEGCAYGAEASPGWLTADLPDDYGVFASRYQTQLAGLLLSLVIFAAAWWGSRQNRLPVMFGLTLGLLALAHAGVSFFRGDPAMAIGGWRLDVLASALIALTSLVALIRLWTIRRQAGNR